MKKWPDFTKYPSSDCSQEEKRGYCDSHVHKKCIKTKREILNSLTFSINIRVGFKRIVSRCDLLSHSLNTHLEYFSSLLPKHPIKTTVAPFIYLFLCPLVPWESIFDQYVAAWLTPGWYVHAVVWFAHRSCLSVHIARNVDCDQTHICPILSPLDDRSSVHSASIYTWINALRWLQSIQDAC